MHDANITLKIDQLYSKDEYRIEIENRISVKAGSCQAAAMARATLMQMVRFEG